MLKKITLLRVFKRLSSSFLIISALLSVPGSHTLSGESSQSPSGASAEIVPQMPKNLGVGVKILPQKLVEELDCLARNIYWESGGESLVGQELVGLVTLNRAASSKFGAGGICAAVRQQLVPGQCQFSWVCSNPQGVGKPVPAGDRWVRSQRVANDLLLTPGKYQSLREQYGEVMWFHGVKSAATSADGSTIQGRPAWAAGLKLIKTVGGHAFYASNK